MAVRSESPRDEEPAISELEETVLGLLEDAGIDTNTNDAICALIDNHYRLQNAEPRRVLPLKVVETILGFDPSNHHNAAVCPYCTHGVR